MTGADRARRYRARQGANTGQVGRPVTATCPSAAGWKRHVRRGESCEACHAAYKAEQRELYRKRKGQAAGP